MAPASVSLIILIPTGQLNVTTPILSVLHGQHDLGLHTGFSPRWALLPKCPRHIPGVPTVVCVLGHVFVNAQVHSIVDQRLASMSSLITLYLIF